MNNPAAFPLPSTTYPNGEFQDPEFGMTLRDYFAAKAMQAIITKLPIVDQTGACGIIVSDKVAYNNDIADSAYQIADAMLKARDHG